MISSSSSSLHTCTGLSNRIFSLQLLQLLPLLLLLFVSFAPPTTVSALTLPESELSNRRKSPALWRNDLIEEDTPYKSRGLVSQPPEVMSPVGGWPQLHAAIGNGADSIYLGLSAFSARARASNFDPIEELPKAVDTCHAAGVKVYVALNTLVFDQELQEVEELIRNCATAHVDALIVQDVGVARLAQTVAPQLEVHASTQQTITSADGAAFCADVFGSNRVVLGRELSTTEIDNVASHLDDSIELEAFVHGALCVSYSGQCFSSEAWGGRSANRGQCAQACRLPYGLIDNGELKELGDFSYLLSPQDLCGLDQVPQLIESHVSCLKIEGRLKDPAYVAATTRAYRNAVDEAWEAYCQKHDIKNNGRRRVIAEPEVITRQELAQVFSRGQDEDNNGLTSGFFEGSQHQKLVRGRSPRHRGVHVGRVEEGSNFKRGLVVSSSDGFLDDLLKPGDGIVIDRGMAQEEELGGSIYEIQQDRNGRMTILFSRGTHQKWKKYDDNVRNGYSAVPLAPAGAHVWKTSDAAVDKKLKRLSDAPAPKVMAEISVTGSIGAPLEVSIRDASGRIGVGKTQGNLEPAEGSGLADKGIIKAIGKLGNTQWVVDQSSIDTTGVEDGAWCPVSWIKEARRIAVEDLQSKVGAGGGDNENSATDDSLSYNVASKMLKRPRESNNNEATDDDDESWAAKISVLARNFEQVDRLCQMVEDDGKEIDEIIVDFLEVEGMREAVERIRKTGNVRTVVASPRIIKPGESGIWRTLLQLEPDGLLVRSTGLLHRMMKLGGAGANIEVKSNGEMHKVVVPELIGDFSLNVANALTAWELLEYGCSRVTASYDLSANAITELLETLGGGGVEGVYQGSGARRVEVIAHTHLPIFHTEHCVFARFLTKGNSYVDCGHACTRHNVHLRDQSGADNLVLADMGCRNTVFSATAQSGVHSLKEWISAGGERFRIELVDESPDDVELIVDGYLGVLRGDTKPRDVWMELDEVKDSNGRKGGVSHGSLRNQVERRAGEIA